MIPAIYDLALGPLLWLATATFLAGSCYRIREMFLLTERKEKIPWPTRGLREDSPEEKKLQPVILFQRSMLCKHPVMTIVSGVFHVCLFVAPLFAMGHTLLLRRVLGVGFLDLPGDLTDFLTILVLAGCLFMLARRILIPQVRALSGLADFVFLALVTAPFLTGFLAYHQIYDYKTVITLHALTSELLLTAVPFTKPAHMVFTLFARRYLDSEHNTSQGGRVWTR